MLDHRLGSMVRQVRAIEVIVTRTEAEALLLEDQLIKSYRPRFNIDLRDDKSYPYIWLDDRHPFPRISFYRGSRSIGGRFYGPYPSAAGVRETLNAIHRVFRLRPCTDSFFAHRRRPCLQHQIQRCSAPCVGLISAERYAQDVAQAEAMLSGRSAAVLSELQAEMERAAHALEFEHAAAVRDRIGALRRIQAKHFVGGGEGDLDVVAVAERQGVAAVVLLYFRAGANQGSHTLFPRLPVAIDAETLLTQFLIHHYTEFEPPPTLLLSHRLTEQDSIAEALASRWQRRVALVSQPRGERAQWLAMGTRTAATVLEAELQSRSGQQQRWMAMCQLLGLPEHSRRVECFDVSHTQGVATVAACVVFGPEGPVKSEYRRYNIAGIRPGDDYAALEQALQRRFRAAAEGGAVLPDLLLIDGGRGQWQRAMEVLRALGLDAIPVVAIAKGPERRAGEERLIAGEREWVPGPHSLAGHWLQQIRDEAHRFAIAGHRARRAKRSQASPLEEIEGIGPTRRRRLLQAFGGLSGVARAGVDELCQVAGIDRPLAERVYAALRR
jgi:excinuclease ABC subunit C